MRDHYRRNAAAYLELSAKRRAAKKRAVPGWFGELDRLAWSEAMRLTRMRRQATGIPWDADHVIALAGFKFCGLHIAENLQVIPAQLNKEKGNKLIFTTPGEWISRL